MNLISILIGIIGFVLMSIGLIPFLGILQWFVMAGAVVGIFFGALFGAILGFVIGQGVFEEDAYLYDDSLTHGTTLLRLLTENDRAREASRIMHQIYAAARARPAVLPTDEVSEAERVQVK